MAEIFYVAKCTNVDITHVTYDAVTYSNYGSSDIIRDQFGVPIRRTIKLTNRIISFSYALKGAVHKELPTFCGTVTSRSINIGGMVVDKETAKIIEINSIPIGEGYSKIFIAIELGDQYNVKKTFIPLEGFYFKDIGGYRRRIQFSSEPDMYTENATYRYAKNVFNGFGYYTEDRPDLNTQDPLPLNEDGTINTTNVLKFVEAVDSTSVNWSSLGIPKKGLV